MNRRIRTTGLVGAMTLSLVVGFVPSWPRTAGAAEPPASFARVSRAALAASIVVRRTDYAADAIALPDSDLGEREFDQLRVLRTRNLGSGGVVVDPSGVALTSARVVGRTPRFEVALIDGTLLKADVVGMDWRTDIAVLKPHSDAPLPYLAFGDSDQVRAGDWIVAVGVPSGLEGTVTAGVITALPTPADPDLLTSFLQTDAALGQGFVGGPLVAMSRELVGLATALHGEGIGYALPATTVRKIYVDLLEKGRVAEPSSW